MILVQVSYRIFLFREEKLSLYRRRVLNLYRLLWERIGVQGISQVTS